MFHYAASTRQCNDETLAFGRGSGSRLCGSYMARSMNLGDVCFVSDWVTEAFQMLFRDDFDWFCVIPRNPGNLYVFHCLSMSFWSLFESWGHLYGNRLLDGCVLWLAQPGILEECQDLEISRVSRWFHVEIYRHRCACPTKVEATPRATFVPP